MAKNSAIVAFLSFCGAYLTVVIAPSLTIVCTSTIVLIVLEDSWVASEVFLLLLVVCGATAAFKIIDYFN